jgi:hypothetical protein
MYYLRYVKDGKQSDQFIFTMIYDAREHRLSIDLQIPSGLMAQLVMVYGLL